MREIASVYGKADLHNIVRDIKGDFADRFYSRIKKYKNFGIKCMSADHGIKRIKQGGNFILIFYNCPIYGVFQKYGLKELGVKTVDVVGCTQFEPDSDCGKKNIPIDTPLNFHPNHIGSVVPSEEP